MPLPPELDGKIRSRFDELIKDGTELIPKLTVLNYAEHIAEYQELAVKSCNLIEKVLSNSERGKEFQRSIEEIKEIERGTERQTKIIVGILKGLKDDYENGFLDDLEKWIAADISADYMGQAEALLGEGIPGQYDHVPAAVLCGAVLEDSLRRLCQRQTPSISIIKSNNGQPKKLNALIDELQKAKVFNKPKVGQLRWWAQIRNSAAHGKFKEFTREDVESMLKGVENFLADYL